MAYNDIIDRSGASALIPEEVSKEIIQSLPVQSTFLRLANRMPNMTRKQLRIPVLTGNAEAYFVNGDTGLKQTTKLTWDNCYITAEEIAAYVVIPQAVLDDSDYDIWAEVRPRIVEAFGRKIDAAVFFGTSKPTSWPDGIVPAAATAGNYKIITDDLYQDINGEGGIVDKVESNGVPVTSYVGALKLRAMLRGATDTNKQPIFRTAYSNGNAGSMVYELNGGAIDFPTNGSWDAAAALLLAGDFRYARYAIRQDVTYTMITQGVITDDEGKVIINLAQQDSVALRCVMRMGWALPKPVNPVAGQNYFPFSVLVPSDSTVIPEDDTEGE